MCKARALRSLSCIAASRSYLLRRSHVALFTNGRQKKTKQIQRLVRNLPKQYLLVFSAYATAIPGYENTKQCIEFICKHC